jgi:hypothetical protein
LEKVYENALAHRLRKLGLDVKQQYPLKVHDENGTLIDQRKSFPLCVSCAFSRLVPLRLLRRAPPANLQGQGTDAGFCPGCRTSRCSLRPNSRTGCGNGCVRDWLVADDPASLPRISTPPARQPIRRPGPRLRERWQSHPKPEVIRDS